MCEELELFGLFSQNTVYFWSVIKHDANVFSIWCVNKNCLGCVNLGGGSYKTEYTAVVTAEPFGWAAQASMTTDHCSAAPAAQTQLYTFTLYETTQLWYL